MCECVHHVPGRLRFRVPALRGSRSLPRALRHSLLTHDGVDGVEIREASCSVIIHYDPDRLNPQDLADILADRTARARSGPNLTLVPPHQGDGGGGGGAGRMLPAPAAPRPVMLEPVVPRPVAPRPKAVTAPSLAQNELAVSAARYLGGVIGRTIFMVLLQSTVSGFQVATQQRILFAMTGKKSAV
jgi:hypothetical protein